MSSWIFARRFNMHRQGARVLIVEDDFVVAMAAHDIVKWQAAGQLAQKIGLGAVPAGAIS